jgi:hypothetical protein
VADESWKAIAATTIVIIVIIAIYFEMRFLRRKRMAKADTATISDEAYNAVITTKAIYSAMERSGIRNLKARELIRRAEMARASGDNRATLDNLANAKEVMLQEKKRHKEIGDLAKLPKTVAAPAVAEETTKEKLQKELPKNYLQAKFMLGFAQKAIDERVSEGGEVSEATSLLAMAQKEFDGKDYDSSLKHGVQARKAAEELIIEIKDTRSAPSATVTTPGTVVPPGVEISVSTLKCRSCGADLNMDDTFCRKCGVKVELAACPSCGTKPMAGDAFCRKCGVALG